VSFRGREPERQAQRPRERQAWRNERDRHEKNEEVLLPDDRREYEGRGQRKSERSSLVLALSERQGEGKQHDSHGYGHHTRVVQRKTERHADCRHRICRALVNPDQRAEQVGVFLEAGESDHRPAPDDEGEGQAACERSRPKAAREHKPQEKRPEVELRRDHRRSGSSSRPGGVSEPPQQRHPEHEDWRQAAEIQCMHRRNSKEDEPVAAPVTDAEEPKCNHKAERGEHQEERQRDSKR